MSEWGKIISNKTRKMNSTDSGKQDDQKYPYSSIKIHEFIEELKNIVPHPSFGDNLPEMDYVEWDLATGIHNGIIIPTPTGVWKSRISYILSSMSKKIDKNMKRITLNHKTRGLLLMVWFLGSVCLMPCKIIQTDEKIQFQLISGSLIKVEGDFESVIKAFNIK